LYIIFFQSYFYSFENNLNIRYLTNSDGLSNSSIICIYQGSTGILWFGTWDGCENFAHPYLWKENPSDSDYQESWGDPRIKKEKKIEKEQELAKNLKVNRERKM